MEANEMNFTIVRKFMNGIFSELFRTPIETSIIIRNIAGILRICHFRLLARWREGSNEEEPRERDSQAESSHPFQGNKHILAMRSNSG